MFHHVIGVAWHRKNGQAWLKGEAEHSLYLAHLQSPAEDHKVKRDLEVYGEDWLAEICYGRRTRNALNLW